MNSQSPESVALHCKGCFKGKSGGGKCSGHHRLWFPVCVAYVCFEALLSSSCAWVSCCAPGSLASAYSVLNNIVIGITFEQAL